jgi:hypothetical protein
MQVLNDVFESARVRWLKVAEKDGSRYLVLETTKEALQGAPSYVYDSNKKVWMPATKQG